MKQPIISDKHNRAGITRFDSVEDALLASKEVGADNINLYNRINADGYSAYKSVTNWLGVNNHNAVEHAIENGWPAGVKKMLEAFKDINTDAIPTDIRRRKSRGDQGDEIDMQAVYAGNLPKAWSRTKRMQKAGVKQVTIVCDLSMSYKTSSEVLFWRGAASLYLADVLQNAGFSVGIVAADAMLIRDGSDDACVTLIDVKRHDMPIDLSAIASTICLTGFYRKICFSITLGHNKKVEASMGSPRTLRRLFPAEAEAMNAMDGLDRVSDKYSAEQWINDQLKQINNSAK